MSAECRKGRIALADITTVAEVLASDAVLSLTLSALLFFWDAHVRVSRFFDAARLPPAAAAAWAASPAAELDYAWRRNVPPPAPDGAWLSPEAVADRCGRACVL